MLCNQKIVQCHCKKNKKRKIQGIVKYKYNGKILRYERGIEHQKGWEDLKLNSHMVKQEFEVHEREDTKEMEFGMAMKKVNKTAFKSQKSESVMIQNEKGKRFILNLKS